MASCCDERFDADRFGTWLEVMVDAGVSSAAATLAAMDVDLLAAGFAEHVRVFDAAAVTSFITLEGELIPGKAFAEGVRAEIAGYVVVAKRVECWDAITTVLNALADAHGAGVRSSDARLLPCVERLARRSTGWMIC